MPDIALSTDILTGFSGETDDDHAETLALMRELRFDSAFMFAYSERDLTFAAKKLPDDVTPAIKQRRLAEIVALQETISGEVFAAHVGRRERVLVHRPEQARSGAAHRPHRRLQDRDPARRRRRDRRARRRHDRARDDGDAVRVAPGYFGNAWSIRPRSGRVQLGEALVAHLERYFIGKPHAFASATTT